MYEITGGHAGDGDDTIFATVARETYEGTGLIVRRITGELGGIEYEAREGLTTVELYVRS